MKKIYVIRDVRTKEYFKGSQYFFDDEKYSTDWKQAEKFETLEEAEAKLIEKDALDTLEFDYQTLEIKTFYTVESGD